MWESVLKQTLPSTVWNAADDAGPGPLTCAHAPVSMAAELFFRE
jgi:hypothetical protein